MDKTFTIAGTTILDGVKGFRFANGKMNLRVNMLKHKGHDKINLVELPKAMTKVQAVAFLTAQGVKAVVPTRAADKKHKPAVQLAAEKMVAANAKRAATRAARKAGGEVTAVAETPAPKKRGRPAKVKVEAAA